MSRPVTITHEQILEAAHDVFMEQGYEDATTALIAKRAGVSEGSLFKRFKGKHELFFAAMELPAPRFLERLDEDLGKGDPKENLVRIATLMLEFFEELLPKAMITWANPAARKAAHQGRPAIRGLQRMSGYFAREMELGRLRKSDPALVARIFGGTLWHACFLKIVFDDRPAHTREQFAREVVEQLWKGLQP